MAQRAKQGTSKKKAATKKKTSRKKTDAGKSAAAPPAEPAPAMPAAGETEGARDLGSALDELLQQSWLHPFRWDWPRWGELSHTIAQQVPSVDVVDREKDVVVRAQMPGVKREDLDVSLAERMLTIKGTTKSEEKEERDDFFRREIRSGTFTRSVLLPADVNAAKAQTSFKDGVLELTLPKVRASKRHKISVG